VSDFGLCAFDGLLPTPLMNNRHLRVRIRLRKLAHHAAKHAVDNVEGKARHDPLRQIGIVFRVSRIGNGNRHASGQRVSHSRVFKKINNPRHAHGSAHRELAAIVNANQTVD